METKTKIRPLFEIIDDIRACKIHFCEKELIGWLEAYAQERIAFERGFNLIKHVAKEHVMSEKAEGLYRVCLELNNSYDKKVTLTLAPYNRIRKIILEEHAESLR
jgi:hypothetical protein